MADLHRLSTLDGSFRGDVIFVHGLDGDPFDSWSLRSDESWATWLAAARPDLRLWTLGYDAASSKWRGTAMPLTDRAVNILATLDGHGLGRLPICLVTHSMGGLIAKQLLREATSTSTEFRAIADSIRGVAFLATPHTGADLASLASYLRAVIRTTDAASELVAHAPALRDLNRWFRNSAGSRDLRVKVFFETQPLHGVIVVDATSADPGLTNVTPIAVDADHVSICKPRTPSDVVYLATLRFLEEVLPGASSAPPDELQSIRQGVLAATSLADLEHVEARLEVHLATKPVSSEALVLRKRVTQALVHQRTMEASPMIVCSEAPVRRSAARRRAFSTFVFWAAILAALGLLLGVVWQWLP